jgi:hypothetical protein
VKEVLDKLERELGAPEGEEKPRANGVNRGLASEYLGTEEERAGPVLPDIESAEGLLADEAVSMPLELVKGVMHQGLKAVIGGSSKVGKTWVLLDLATAVASGRNWLKFPCAAGKVLFINFEIPRPFIRSRLLAVKKCKGLERMDKLDVWTLRGHATSLDVLRAQLVDKIKKGGYALVIIDPIYKCYGQSDENKASDIARLCNELERIAVETGAAVVYEAHYSKGNQSAKESIDRISGSGVFTRDADTIINFTKHAEEDCYTVEMVLRNLPMQDPFVVEWRYPVMDVRENLDPANLKEAKPKNRGALATAENVFAQIPIEEGAYILKEALIAKCSLIPLGEKRTMRFAEQLADEGRIFRWRVRRSGTRPAIGFGRTEQPEQEDLAGVAGGRAE